MPATELENRVQRSRLALAAVLLSLGCALVYGRTAGFGLLSLDEAAISKNPSLLYYPQWRVLPTVKERAENFEKLLESDPLRPAVFASYVFDLVSIPDAASSHHATNIFLHLFTVLLVFLLAHRILRERSGGDPDPAHIGWAALLASAVAFHPVQVEAVALASSRPHLLAVFFSALSLFSLREALRGALRAEKPAWVRSAAYGVGITFFVGALLSNVEALVLPAILALGDAAGLVGSPRGGEGGRRTRLFFYAPLFLLSLLALWFYLTLDAARASLGGPGTDLGSQAAQVFRYLGLYLVPVGLSVEHGRIDWAHFYSPLSLTALAGHAVLAGALFLLWRRGRRGPLASLLALYLVLLPTGILGDERGLLTERRAYAGTLFFALLAASLFFRAMEVLRERGRPVSPRLAAWVSLAAVLLWAGGACARVGIWRSEESLWRDAIVQAPGLANPHYQLGLALLGQDRKDEALEEFGLAIKADPAFYLAAVNRGILLMERSDFLNAEMNFLHALRADPRYAPALYNLAQVYYQSKKYQTALEWVRKALEQRPGDVVLLELEGDALAGTGDALQALDAYGKVLDAGGGANREELLRRAAVLALDKGYFDTAEKYFRLAIGDFGENAENWYNLGRFLEARGRDGEAIDAYRRALIHDPALAKAYFNKARLHEKDRACDSAGAAYRLASLYAPQYAGAFRDFERRRKERVLSCRDEGVFR